jgi:hypothetical protein
MAGVYASNVVADKDSGCPKSHAGMDFFKQETVKK